ncbi:MAG TPA: hypothetical protein PKY82_28005 [Pyrinomonadaceae bacterium]|nr:hypothetical protein [Pyrinomonadaceae bacterium]
MPKSRLIKGVSPILKEISPVLLASSSVPSTKAELPQAIHFIIYLPGLKYWGFELQLKWRKQVEPIHQPT